MSAASYLSPADGSFKLEPASIDPTKEHRARMPLRIPLQQNGGDFLMGSDCHPAGLVS